MAGVARGEVAPVRRKEGDNTSWIDANLTEPKNEKKINVVELVAINGR
jgi:hypothetical protein